MTYHHFDTADLYLCAYDLIAASGDVDALHLFLDQFHRPDFEALCVVIVVASVFTRVKPC